MNNTNNQIQKGETLLLEERIKDPIQSNVDLFYNHFGRYFYASKALNISEEDIIIDGSCGCGYGSCALANKAKYVYGLDVNESYLEIAKKNLNKDNLEYLTYKDFYQLNKKVDKIICIETYEHIPKEENDIYLKNLLNCLKDDGSMFVTIPLGNNDASTYNPFHCFEPDLKYIYNIFSKYFKKINIEIDTFKNSFGYISEFCYITLKNKIKGDI